MSAKDTGLPYRFKAGGVTTLNEEHHHWGTRKLSHKRFKSRYTTKSAIKKQPEGKMRVSEEQSARRTPHQQVMSKLDRQNSAKQKRLATQQAQARETSIFSGRDGAPRIVTVVPLCRDTSGTATVLTLLSSVGALAPVPDTGLMRVSIDRFKQKIDFLVVDRDLMAVLDACRLADFVVFVISANTPMDSYGELLLNSVDKQGLSTTFAVIEGLYKLETAKKRQQTITTSKAVLKTFLPSLQRIQSLDSQQECLNLMRSLCASTPKGVLWREDRSWMLVENVQWLAPTTSDSKSEESCKAILTGIIRGRSLKANRLVQIGDWGSYQLDKITAAPLGIRRKGDEKSLPELVSQEIVLDQATDDRESLEHLAPEDIAMEGSLEAEAPLPPPEQRCVLLDDLQDLSGEVDHTSSTPRKLPKGTSQYQAAWYLGSTSDSGSDLEEFEEVDNEDGGRMDLDDTFDHGETAEFLQPADMELTETLQSDYPQSEKFWDRSLGEEADQLALYRSERKAGAHADLDFPDEVELHPNMLARERLSRYRGLRSVKTSAWDIAWDRAFEPPEWRRLLEVSNFKAAKSRALKDELLGGVCAGTRVDVHVANLPSCILEHYDPTRPLGLFSLLRHERKHTAVHCSIKLESEMLAPLKSKEELIVQYGPRRVVANPLFSQLGNVPNDVHQFNRYLHPGQTAVASFIGPLTFGAVPVLYFKMASSSCVAEGVVPSEFMKLVATGTVLPPSKRRVIAKRIVLTGHPFKIHKRVVTVRYMFFNAADVEWFRPLRLWTRRGRSGFIKESLGTHGYFKATFDGRINPQDSVAISLYKRMWPKVATEWTVVHRKARATNR